MKQVAVEYGIFDEFSNLNCRRLRFFSLSLRETIESLVAYIKTVQDPIGFNRGGMEISFDIAFGEATGQRRAADMNLP